LPRTGRKGHEMDGHIVFSSEVEILNISIGGAALTLERKLDIGSRCSLELEGMGRTIAIDGLIVWSVKGGGRNSGSGRELYKAGMKFTDVFHEKVNELVAFIGKYKKSEETRLGGLRFTIFSPEKAFLRYSQHFTIKELTPEGATIETHEPLTPGETLPMEIFFHEIDKLEFVGKVASSDEPSPSHGQYEIAVEFAEISEQDRAKLKSHLQSSQ
jgi:hypothetical protein